MYFFYYLIYLPLCYVVEECRIYYWNSQSEFSPQEFTIWRNDDRRRLSTIELPLIWNNHHFSYQKWGESEFEMSSKLGNSISLRDPGEFHPENEVEKFSTRISIRPDLNISCKFIRNLSILLRLKLLLKFESI